MDAALIDESRFALLTASLGGDTAAAERFVGDFVAAWPARWDRLWAALQRRDGEDVRAVLLSIQSSSTMVGAPTLADVASALFADWSRFEAVHPDALARLHEIGGAVSEALTRQLRERGVSAA